MLMNEIINDTIMYINILTSGKFPLLIKDALHEEEKTEDSKEETRISFNCHVKYNMRKEVKAWNAGLLKLLCEKIEILSIFSGTIEELKEMERENRKHILNELENERVKAYRTYISYMPPLLEKYERKIELIGELLVAVYKNILENKKYGYYQKREMIREEEKSIKTKIISVLASCIGSEDEEKNIEYVNNMLVSIIEEYTVRGKLDQDKIGRKRKDLTDSILGVFVFDEKNTNKCIDSVLAMRDSMRGVLDEIIDIVIAKEIEESTYREYELAREEIVRRFRSINWDTHIPFIVEYLNRYYNLIDKTKFSYALNPYASRKYKTREEPIAKAIGEAIKNQTIGEWIENSIEEHNQEEINILLRVIQIIHKCRSMVNYRSEIWISPIYLILDLVKNNDNSEGIKYFKELVKYREEKSGKVFEKEVDFTDENLEAFRSAKKLDDIENMKGISLYSCV